MIIGLLNGDTIQVTRSSLGKDVLLKAWDKDGQTSSVLMVETARKLANELTRLADLIDNETQHMDEQERQQ